MPARADRKATGRLNKLRLERLAALALEQPVPSKASTAPSADGSTPPETGPPTFTGRQQISVGNLSWGVVPDSFVEHFGDGRFVRVIGPDGKLHHLTEQRGKVVEILFSAAMNEAVLRKLKAGGLRK